MKDLTQAGSGEVNVTQQPILVTGATGNTGSPLVDLLTQRGAAVRVMVRHEADAKHFDTARVTVVVADFDDEASLAAALAGADRAYLVTPSSEEAAEQQVRFAETAAGSGIGHLVVLSQFAAKPDSPVRFLRWHAEVERQIRELGVGYTFLRPNLFFQGLLAAAQTIAATSHLFAPVGDARVSAVDVRDIAAVAAVALTEPGHDGKVYTITGPAAITHGEIAAALSAAVGHEITFVDSSPQDFAAGLRGILPPWQIDGLLEDYAHYSRGEAAEVYPTVADVTGRQPISVGQFARDYAAAFAPPQ
jgi:uncharacterized protein YbjT (DUF2867 family)